jgi:hypothetical protein
MQRIGVQACQTHQQSSQRLDHGHAVSGLIAQAVGSSFIHGLGRPSADVFMPDGLAGLGARVFALLSMSCYW